MPKRAGQSADDVEADLLPKTDGWRVRRNHEIELHGAKTHSARLGQTMLGHTASDSGALRIRCHHESGVGHMRAGTELIGSENVSTDNACILFCDISLRIGSKPVRQRILARDLGIERV